MLRIVLITPTFRSLVLVSDNIGHLTPLRASVIYIHIILLHIGSSLILQNEVLRDLRLMFSMKRTPFILSIHVVILIHRVLHAAASSCCEGCVGVIILTVLRRSDYRALHRLVDRSVVTK